MKVLGIALISLGVIGILFFLFALLMSHTGVFGQPITFKQMASNTPFWVYTLAVLLFIFGGISLVSK